jgi:hypothetical protein
MNGSFELKLAPQMSRKSWLILPMIKKAPTFLLRLDMNGADCRLPTAGVELATY